MTLPSCAGPLDGGDMRMADNRTGRTDVTFAEYFWNDSGYVEIPVSHLNSRTIFAEGLSFE